MNLPNKICRVILFFAVLVLWVRAGKIQGVPQGHETPEPASQNRSTRTPEIPTQKIDVPPASQAQPAAEIKQTGSLSAADVKALLAKFLSSDDRINDLL